MAWGFPGSGRPLHTAVKPPSTVNSVPVMNLEASEDRNSTAAAMSTGFPIWPAGVSPLQYSTALSRFPSKNRSATEAKNLSAIRVVPMNPGCTRVHADAVSHLRAFDCDGLREVPHRPLEEQYADMKGNPMRPAIERHVDDESLEIVEEEEKGDVTKLESDAKLPPVVQIVNHIFTEAIAKGASDIHIEPYEDRARVRYRIDGILYEALTLPLKYKDGVISRVKVLTKMDIAEKRLPQDGRIKIQMKLSGRMKNIDIRVSTTPTIFGEKVVMRLLDREGLMLDMAKLGFEPESLRKFEEAIFKPWGMILVTGPTGSGKTNTLYSAIGRINSPDTNIMTVEDPVEFNIGGINQVQVHETIDLTFASVLRSFLRQDPNVILVGEIRDNETADIAVKASLTGHLVLSTLHTNDAPSTIIRLIDMGIDSYLVATSVILIAAQRLVRRICPACKEEVAIPPKALLNVGFSEEEAATMKIYKGKGCPKCNNTGYKGRIALYRGYAG